MHRKFNIILTINKQTCIYDTNIQLLNNLYERLKEIEKNIDDELVRLSGEVEGKSIELKNKVYNIYNFSDLFANILLNNKLLPDIPKKYFKNRRSISDWLNNKKSNKIYIDYINKISVFIIYIQEIDTLISNYYSDFYIEVSNRCERYLTLNSIWSNYPQYQEVEKQFEDLHKYSSKDYDNVYKLYEQLLPNIEYKFVVFFNIFQKDEPLTELIHIPKLKKKTKKVLEEKPKEKIETKIETKTNKNKNQNKNKNLSEKIEKDEADVSIGSFLYYLVLPILLFLYKFLIEIPLYYIIYIPAGLYFSIYYSLYFNEKEYKEGDNVYYYIYKTWNKWWSYCKVLSFNDKEKTYKLIDIETAEIYTNIESETLFTHYSKEFFSSNTIGKLNKRVFLLKNYLKFFKPDESCITSYNIRDQVEVQIRSDKWSIGSILEYDNRSKKYTVKCGDEILSDIPNYILRPVIKENTKIKYYINSHLTNGIIYKFLGDGLYNVDNSENFITCNSIKS